MTEKIQERLEAMEGVDIGSLYNDVHSRIRDVVHKQKKCFRPLEKLGYPNKTELTGSDNPLKAYNQWWL